MKLLNKAKTKAMGKVKAQGESQRPGLWIIFHSFAFWTIFLSQTSKSSGYWVKGYEYL
jgi:hypothetical protein